MNLNQYLNQIRIDVIGKTVFINSKAFEFCYTAAKHMLKDEFKDQYRYVGGLQCEFDSESEDYKKLERKLCDIAEAVLESLVIKKEQYVGPSITWKDCTNGCTYSKSMDQEYPRKCVRCGKTESDVTDMSEALALERIPAKIPCSGHIYSRGINEPRPRKCQICGEPEPEK